MLMINVSNCFTLSVEKRKAKKPEIRDNLKPKIIKGT